MNDAILTYNYVMTIVGDSLECAEKVGALGNLPSIPKYGLTLGEGEET